MTAWTVERLDNCCQIVSGATPSTAVAKYWGGDIPWVTPKDLSNLGSATICNTPRKLTQAGLAASSASLLPAGSVLFSSRAPIGHVAINSVPMATNQGFKSFVPQPDRLHAPYLYWWLRTNKEFLQGLGNGATFKEVSKAVVSRIEIPLPPLPEQRRIADILDQADALRAKRRAALNQLDKLKKSIFLDMFASQASEHWPLVSIASVVAPSPGSIRTGPFGSQLLHSEFVDSGVAVLGIDNAVENEFRWAKLRYISPEKYKVLTRYTAHPGDVLITIMGTCGRCAIVPDDIPLAINTKHLCCITLDQTSCLPAFLHSYFLHHPLSQQYLRQTAKGAVMDGLNMGIIQQLPLRLPPLPLQDEYVRRICTLKSVHVAQRQSKSAFDALFYSLQHRTFRGEL